MFEYDIDNLTLSLLLAVVAVLLYELISKPTALVHPLLLGRQAEVSSVRQEGESGVYRSFATGHGTPFIVRPANTLKTVHDAVRPVYSSGQRDILGVPLTDDALLELVRLLPLGLRALFPFKAPEQQQCRPILVVLPPSPSASLPLLLLALAAGPDTPIIILPTPRLLIKALEENDAHSAPGIVVAHESIAEGVIEQVAEARGGLCGVLVAGDTTRRLESLGRKAAGHGVDVRFWEDLWTAAEDMMGLEVPKPQPGDLHSYYYAEDGEVVSFTHQNFTAGIAGLLALFTADKRPGAGDVVASAVPLTQPVGLTIALASMWSGASFRFLGSEEAGWEGSSDAARDLVGARATIVFGTRQHHEAITTSLHDAYRQSSLAQLTLGSKIASLQEGNVSRGGTWDRLAWRSLRRAAPGGDSLRALIVVDGEPLIGRADADAPSEAQLALSNLLLSLPTSRISTSVRAAGPLTVSHMYDLQAPLPDLESSYQSQSTGKRAHSGAPANNIELVLRDVPPSAFEAEKAAPIKGVLWARGPSLGTVRSDFADANGWVSTGRNAAVATNGTFCVDAYAP